MLLALAEIGLEADKHIPRSGRVVAWWAACFLLGPWFLPWVASTAVADADVGRLFRSHHVRLHTDLDSVRARQCLQRIERVLTLASKYWGRPLPGEIDAYVVDQLDRWPAAAFPLPQASLVLKHIGGGTALERPTDHAHRALQTCIYATTQPGVIEHEAVHAYCFQTFGRGGPSWYQEGMAEVLAAASRAGSWTCRSETRRLLRSTESISVAQILARNDFTRELGESVRQASAGPNGVAPPIAFDVTRWRPRDQQVLRQTRQAYAESWALCHLLSRNANYRAAFRRLGRRVLEGDTLACQEQLAAAAPRIDFELEQLRQHLEDGYQADLCRWPWEATFALLGVDESTRVRVPARAGFQATGLLVAPGQTYALRSTGQWTLKPGDAPVNGHGNADGWGDLEACVMHGFRLSPPVRLTGDCLYTPAQAGRLFVRCRDRWHQLSDNHGELQVSLLRVR